MENQIPFAFEVPSVSDVTLKIKTILESNFRDVLVEGELSNVNQSRNGHFYFTVKDEEAQLPCVIWRSSARRLGVEIRDGQQVILGGDIQVYAPHGRYQMIVTLVQQAGLGKLQQKFEELKQKLQKEGLFDEACKKPIPPFPMRVGVITSSTGAAFQDIRSTFEQRWPVATLYLYHASVQGLNSAGELVKAITYFSNQPNPVDVLIIGRGGGSLEDLWPFNEEAVARALFDCPVPVISAVGHEVDFSISDFVADARAATPTQAVIIAAPDMNELRYQIEDYTSTLEQTLRRQIQYYRDYVYRLAHSHALQAVQDRLKYQANRLQALKEKMLSIMKIRVDQTGTVEIMRERLQNRMDRLITQKRSQLRELHSAMEAGNPKAPLKRGFSRVLQDGKWIRSRENFVPEKSTELEWRDGKITLNQKL